MMLFGALLITSVCIGIFINPTVLYNIQNYTELIPGRMQALELIINDKEINLISVYGPNNDDGNFFEQLETYLREKMKKYLLLVVILTQYRMKN